MSALFGALGRAVGGITSVAGGVASGVGNVVTYVFAEEDDDERGYDDDEPNIYEQKAKVDQILFFFENEFDRHKAYFKDQEAIEEEKVEYYNCVNAVEFQNEVIAQLVGELLDLRAQLRGSLTGRPPRTGGPGSAATIAAAASARKEALIRAAHIKLDIGERKSKRMFKEKDRRVAWQRLSPIIAEAKMQRFMEEQANAKREAEEEAAYQRRSGHREKANDRDSPVVQTSQMEAHQTSSGLSRRTKYKHYSDAELSALLGEKDD